MKANVGDIITLGSYPQSDKYNGTVDPIEWKVLDKAEGKALVISVKGLDMVRVNEKYADVTWETSIQRAWMNGEFLEKAFTAEEKALILDTKVTTAGCEKCGTCGGADTTDKVFALSKEEIEKYFPEKDARRAATTPYALTKGMYQCDENGSCVWWTRSIGCQQFAALRVNVTGGFSGTIYDDNKAHRAARPAMWIKVD